MTDVDPEKATIGDLFRLMTEVRGELSSIKHTVEGHTATLGEHTATLGEHTATLGEHTDKLDAAAAEREAIRNVVDNDLASHDQMLRIEGDIVEVKKAQRLHGKKIDGLAERMDQAGIPVR